jgi:hypothetical protein
MLRRGSSSDNPIPYYKSFVVGVFPCELVAHETATDNHYTQFCQGGTRGSKSALASYFISLESTS